MGIENQGKCAGGSPFARRFVQGRARSGYTVVEITVMTTILVVGVLGMVGGVVAGMRLFAVEREKALGQHAARTVIARMETTAFPEIFATYNADPRDDPGQAGTAPGSGFAIDGMTVQPNDTDGFVGEILFPTIEIGGALFLCESFADPRFGMPRDLNGDGVISAGAMPGACMILPVRVHVSWRGAGGDRSIDVDDVFISHGDPAPGQPGHPGP